MSSRDGSGASRASLSDSSATDLGELALDSLSSTTEAESTHSANLGEVRLGPSADHARASLPYRDQTRYEFIAEHGRGGLGRVYRARDLELSREVALKELLRPTDGAEARFLREVLVTAQLEHPGIVPIHEAGRWPNGTPYYAMKLVAGRPLSALLKNARTLDERLALLPHLIAVADAMAYAHDRKVIHRDLKPANIIVGDYGETVVIDWGLAKELTDESDEELELGPYRSGGSPDLTMDGTVLGTPAYMSPEQARGERVDTRADVYALGALLFQLCTGAAPRSEATSPELHGQLRGLSPDLAAIALKALQASPEDRYPSASEFAADLRSYDAGARITARTYSLLAVLGHWLRHHKGAALSMAIPLAVIAVIGVLSLREILLQRDRATASQNKAEAAHLMAEGERATAERERDRSVLSEVKMLLGKDPTKARDLLASRGAFAPDVALLMARAQGGVMAEHVLSLLPFKAWGALPDDRFQTIALTTSDHKLRVLDVGTGRVEVVAAQLLEPPVITRQDDGLIYGRHSPTGPVLVQAGASAPIAFGALRRSTDEAMVAVPDGLYLLGRNGDLLFLQRGQREFQVVRRGVGGILPHGRDVLACADKELVQISGGRVIGAIDHCLNERRRHFFATTRDGYVAQATPSDVVISTGGTRRLLPIPEPNQFAIAADGLVVGIDGNNRSWYVTANGAEKQYGPSSDAIPIALGADGHLAVWGDMDGVAHVRDTASGATWTLVGHSGPIAWIFVSEKQRKVVTVGGAEVRVWRIPTLAVRPVVRLPCSAFMMASSPDRTSVAVTCGDGTVSLVERRADERATARTLYKHNSLAFGVTWRGDDVCSSGRDGKVVCTDVRNDAVRLLAEHEHPIRFVHSAGDVLAYTVEDGSVWSHVTGDERPTLLYHHTAEPYRVAVSATGNVASGANDGSVMSFDRKTGKVHRADLHTDSVFRVHWRGDELITSSHDGTVRTWRLDLTPKGVTSVGVPLRHLELLGSAWVANAGGTRLWLHHRETEFSIDTGPTITDLSASPDGRFAGAVVGGDFIVYDVRNQAIAAVPLGDDDGLHFVDDTTIFFFGSPSGEISSLSTVDLSFVQFRRGGSVP